MIVRALGAAVVLLIAPSYEAFAARNHSPSGRVSCTDVRYYVAKYSAPVAEMYAAKSRRHRRTDRAGTTLFGVKRIGRGRAPPFLHRMSLIAPHLRPGIG